MAEYGSYVLCTPKHRKAVSGLRRVVKKSLNNDSHMPIFFENVGCSGYFTLMVEALIRFSPFLVFCSSFILPSYLLSFSFNPFFSLFNSLFASLFVTFIAILFFVVLVPFQLIRNS